MVQRCRSLGLTVVSVACDGQVTVPDPTGWLERLIAQSPVFSKQTLHHLPTLASHPGQAAEIWPGLWLVSLSAFEHEQMDRSDHPEKCTVALLPTASFVEGEWFTLLCEQNQLDRQAALAQMDRSVLLGDDESNRMITLIGWMAQDEVHFDRQANDLQIMGKHLGDSYEEINMLYRLSASLTIDHPEPCLLTQACQELYRWWGSVGSRYSLSITNLGSMN